MVKKIAALAGAGALLLSLAGPAFAWGWWGGSRDVAIVDNVAIAEADTGGNTQDNYALADGFLNDADVTSDGSRSMVTGSADAYAGALVVANAHVGCGPCAGGGWGHKDFATVLNYAGAGAYSGGNAQDDVALADGFLNDADVTSGGSRVMSTGPASSTARAWSLVNIHWGD